MDCIFCKIVSGDAPCMKLYEDKHTMAFMDIAGDVDGHILVVPKRHVTGVLDCDDNLLSCVMATVKKISRHCTKCCDYDGVNILNASEAAAGQSVPHLHFHVIPRKENDGLNTWPTLPGAKFPLEEIYKQILKDL